MKMKLKSGYNKKERNIFYKLKNFSNKISLSLRQSERWFIDKTTIGCIIDIDRDKTGLQGKKRTNYLEAM